MSITYIAFYPSDWLAGTRGMSDAETGIYITLIAKMYEMAGPIERDDERLYRLCGSKSKRGFQKALGYLLAEGKIIQVEGELFNERVQKEIQRTVEKSSKASDAAHTRWNKKSNKNKGGTNATASPKHMPQPCQPEPEPYIEEKRDTNVSLKKKPPRRKTRMPDDAVCGADFIAIAQTEGHDEREAIAQFERFKDSASAAGRMYVDWKAAWRNWFRSQYFRPVYPKHTPIAGGNNAQHHDQNGLPNGPSNRPDPALEQISRLAGLSQT